MPVCYKNLGWFLTTKTYPTCLHRVGNLHSEGSPNMIILAKKCQKVTKVANVFSCSM